MIPVSTEDVVAITERFKAWTCGCVPGEKSCPEADRLFAEYERLDKENPIHRAWVAFRQHHYHGEDVKA